MISFDDLPAELASVAELEALIRSLGYEPTEDSRVQVTGTWSMTTKGPTISDLITPPFYCFAYFYPEGWDAIGLCNRNNTPGTVCGMKYEKAANSITWKSGIRRQTFPSTSSGVSRVTMRLDRPTADVLVEANNDVDFDTQTLKKNGHFIMHLTPTQLARCVD